MGTAEMATAWLGGLMRDGGLLAAATTGQLRTASFCAATQAVSCSSGTVAGGPL